MRAAISILALACSGFLVGCEIVGPLVGAGVGTAVKKDQDSEVSETFTQPLVRTKAALMTALKRMGIEVTSSEGDHITGKTKEHPVEIKLTRITQSATKVTVKIGEGLKKDRATAEEIVDQTKRALGTG
jgi:hypothetical protein